MTHDLSKWYEDLEKQAATTFAQAKRAADCFDDSIWELASGRYIAMRRGVCVPPYAVRVATRVSGKNWRRESAEKIQKQLEQQAGYEAGY